jgi:Undecaprenyl-phosphate galactose phosphotransferase WbaP
METTGTQHIEIEAVRQEHIVARVHQRNLMSIAMIFADLASILLAAVLGAGVRAILLGPLNIRASLWVPFFIAAFVLAASLRDLYPAVGMSAIEQFRQITSITSLFMTVVIVTTFFLRVGSSFSRLQMAVAWLFCLIIIPFNRTIIRHLLVKLDRWGEPVAVIGARRDAERVAKYYTDYPKVGLKPEVLLFSSCADLLTLPEARGQLEERFSRVRSLTPIRTVVVACSDMSSFSAVRETFRDLFETVIVISPEDFQMDLGGVSIRQYGDMLAFEVRHSLMDRSAQLQKRLLDLFISVAGLLVLAPFLALVALLITLDSPGGVLYRQKRIGKNGRVFDMLKFRTMRKDADQVLRAYLDANPEAASEWATYQKLQHDPRITRVGRLLRRFSFDEFPQLFNVLLGEMSIVGPRPIMLDQREMYGNFFCHYVRVVPGVTGLWQISGRNRTSFAQRTRFDAEYVNTWSIWMDIYIIIRTVWVVIRRNGAY